MSLPSNPRSTYRIFISFNDADQAIAEYLAKGLRRILDDYDAVYCFSLPGRYNSKAGTRPADDYMKLIDDTLKSCNVFILLWSTDAKDSKWIVYEFNLAKHFYINQTVRLGHKFKIVPVRINRCGLPIGIHNLDRINYSSGEDMQDVLNEILAVLSLPAENDENDTRIIKDSFFEIKTAYRNGEWTTVAQKYPLLVNFHPGALSAMGHYMYAIALAKQGQVQDSCKIVHEALDSGYQHHEEDAELLHIYVRLVRERKLWGEVLYIAERGAALFPNDGRWFELRLEAFNNMNQNGPNTFNRPPTSILLQSQQQQPPQMNVNGTTRLLVGNETIPLSYLQQSSYLASSAISSPLTQEFSLTDNAPPIDPVTEQIPVVGNVSHATEDFSDEEFPSDNGTVVWGRDFIRAHFSPQKLHRLLSKWLFCVVMLDLFCLYLIALVWPMTATWMGWEFAIVGIGLCIGRMIEAVECKLLCLVAFCILWGIGGYGLGGQLLNWLGLGVSASISFRNLMDYVGAAIGIAIVWGSHYRLFYPKR